MPFQGERSRHQTVARRFAGTAVFTSAERVNYWVAQLQMGDKDAVRQLWDLIFHRMVGHARQKLQGLPSRMANEEDVALSAFYSFIFRAEQGQFPASGGATSEKNNLWPLLMHITACKALKLQRDERRQKRGGGQLLPTGTVLSEAELCSIVSEHATPEVVDLLVADFHTMLDNLADSECRTIAVLKLEGLSNSDIATQLGIPVRRVQRRLQYIRAAWEDEADEP